MPFSDEGDSEGRIRVLAGGSKTATANAPARLSTVVVRNAAFGEAICNKSADYEAGGYPEAQGCAHTGRHPLHFNAGASCIAATSVPTKSIDDPTPIQHAPKETALRATGNLMPA